MENKITVVSGLPRSGTSMMMSMLVAGGLEPLVDNIRTADDDNPKGYFELERVKELPQNKEWLREARGKVVKIISALLRHLPEGHLYDVVFMQRNMIEILASQRQMLIRRGEQDKIPDDKMADLFQKHLKDVFAWIDKQSNFRVLFVNYNQILEAPLENVKSVNEFLGGSLDQEAMLSVIDTALHRQRR